AAIAIAVVNADMIMSQRTRATVALKSLAGSLFADDLSDTLMLGMTLTMTTRSIVAAADDAGVRLDRVLATHVAELSRSRLKALIEAGAVAVGGRTIRDPSHRVNSGDAIALDVPPPEPAKPAPEAIPLKVVYESGLGRFRRRHVERTGQARSRSDPAQGRLRGR